MWIFFILGWNPFLLLFVAMIVKIKQGKENGKHLENLDKKLEAEYSREKKSSTKIDT